jgi:hypothetical protein
VAAPQKAQVGYTLHPRFGLVGIEVSKGRMDVVSKVEIVDEEAKDVRSVIDVVLRGPASAQGGSVSLDLSTNRLTRPGRFLIRVTCTDNIANKTLKFELPLEVTAP